MEPEIEEDEFPAEDISDFHQNVVNVAQEQPPVTVEEPVGEPQKKTWASIVSTRISMF